MPNNTSPVIQLNWQNVQQAIIDEQRRHRFWYPSSLKQLINLCAKYQSKHVHEELTSVDHQHLNQQALFEVIRILVTQNQWDLNTAYANYHPLIQSIGPSHLQACDSLHRIGRVRSSLLTEGNFNAIARHTKPHEVADALQALNEAGLLQGDEAQANRDTITQHMMPISMAFVLYILNEVGLLQGDEAQANFDRLMDPAHQWLISQQAILNIWSRIPPHLLTQQVFNDLLWCARQPDAEQRAQNYVHALIGHDPNQAQQYINNAQSTHTASVHHSVSNSALRLSHRYQQTLTQKRAFDQTWRAISKWLKNCQKERPQDSKVQAAVRAWARYYDHHFIEQGSNVSMQQIIVAFWQAIHDPNNHQLADSNDGRERLLEALYENQRGYNLDAQGHDNNQSRDLIVCTGGQFNKFIEKLVGVHPDAELVYITQATANERLPAVVKEAVNRYLTDHPEMTSEVRRDQSAKPIWSNIRDQVLTTMNQEFNVESGLNQQTIEAIVDYGSYVSISYEDLFQAFPQSREASDPKWIKLTLFANNAEQRCHVAMARGEKAETNEANQFDIDDSFRPA